MGAAAAAVWTLAINEVTCLLGETVVACLWEIAWVEEEASGPGATEERGGSGGVWSSVEGGPDFD